jgi:hypothetical protein
MKEKALKEYRLGAEIKIVLTKLLGKGQIKKSAHLVVTLRAIWKVTCVYFRKLM